MIGTPPNMILMEFMTRFSDHPLNFGSWIAFSLPDVFINLVILWFVLQLYFLRNHKYLLKNIKNIVSKEKVSYFDISKYLLGAIRSTDFTITYLLILFSFKHCGY